MTLVSLWYKNSSVTKTEKKGAVHVSYTSWSSVATLKVEVTVGDT